MSEGPPQGKVRCPKHGIFYKPSEAAGCFKCLEEEQGGVVVREDSGAGGGFRLMPVVWILVLAGVGWGGYVGVQAMGDRGGEIFEETKVTASRIDPEMVRVPIVALEMIVYGDADWDYGTRVNRQAAILFTGVTLKASHLLAARHGAMITALGRALMTRQDPEAPPSLDEVDELRREWETVRDEVFNDASWYRSIR